MAGDSYVAFTLLEIIATATIKLRSSTVQQLNYVQPVICRPLHRCAHHLEERPFSVFDSAIKRRNTEKEVLRSEKEGNAAQAGRDLSNSLNRAKLPSELGGSEEDDSPQARIEQATTLAPEKERKEEREGRYSGLKGGRNIPYRPRHSNHFRTNFSNAPNCFPSNFFLFSLRWLPQFGTGKVLNHKFHATFVNYLLSYLPEIYPTFIDQLSLACLDWLSKSELK